MDIYQLSSYKEVLKHSLLDRKKSVSKSYSFQNMANACSIQKTYLSAVLNDDSHLNDDQLFLACNYLGFSTEETTFTTLLHSYERSANKKRKDKLFKEIEQFRQNINETENFIDVPKTHMSANDLTEYYLSPFLQVLHVFLTIKAYAFNVDKVALKLNCPNSEVVEGLKKLSQLGIITFKDNHYQVNNARMHLPSGSSIYSAYRTLMHLKTIENMQKRTLQKPYSFSVIFSTRPEIKEKIHRQFLEFLSNVEKEVVVENPTDVYQMNFDLFSWS